MIMTRRKKKQSKRHKKVCHETQTYLWRLWTLFRSNAIWKKVNQLEKNKVDVDSLRENHKEFIKNNKLILKLQQRFRREKHNGIY